MNECKFRYLRIIEKKSAEGRFFYILIP